MTTTTGRPVQTGRSGPVRYRPSSFRAVPLQSGQTGQEEVEMIQAVQQYNDAMAAADEAYQQAEQTRQTEREAAWTELGESDNAFVAWAVTQVNESGQYKRETLAILAELPEHPVAQDVRNAASRFGSTGVVTEAVRRAVEAGVLSEGDQSTEAPREDAQAPAGEARRRFLDQVRSQVGSHAVSGVQAALDAIVAEEAAAHVARHTN